MRTATLEDAVAALTVITLMSAAMRSQPAADAVDLDAVYRIKDEGLQRSQVIETLSYLTDKHGPRLTNSPNIRKDECIQPEDMMKNAVTIASFVYQAASRDDLLPRKPLPKPRSPGPATTAQ